MKTSERIPHEFGQYARRFRHYSRLTGRSDCLLQPPWRLAQSQEGLIKRI
jgi:hypothetical protein